jgi:hypothetical protein
MVEHARSRSRAGATAGTRTPSTVRAAERPPPGGPRVMQLLSLQRKVGNAAVTGLLGAGAGAAGRGGPLAPEVRQDLEPKLGHDFGDVRVHTDDQAAESARAVGAKAYTVGTDIVFGAGQYQPGTDAGRQVLAHELTHVIQQKAGPVPGTLTDSGARVSDPSDAFEQHAEQNASGVLSGKAPLAVPSGGVGGPGSLQAIPTVTNVVPSAAEIGVGRHLDATATAAGNPRLTWALVGAPAGVTVSGSRRNARIQASAGALAGAGTAFTVRAALASNPADNFVSANVMLVGITNATFTPAPLFPAIASLIPATGPANTADPNRDGVTGNTSTVAAVTAPVGRPPPVVTLPSPRGATSAGAVITPGTKTGNLPVRVRDAATGTERTFNLPINPVPLRLSGFGGQVAAGPYGCFNGPMTWKASDTANPLNRVIGEAMTLGARDDFNIMPGFNGIGPNPAPILALAVPANAWTDQVVTGSGNALIDVNRFVGPGVAQTLPARSIIRQGFHWLGWAGVPNWSNEFEHGVQRRSLVQQAGAFRFTTEHIHTGATAAVRNEAYVGPPLINLTNVTATPLAPPAASLAADGVATASVTVATNVPGRTVNWTVLTGTMAFTAGAAAAPVGGAATLQAGAAAGSFQVRVADSVFPNRRAEGTVRIVAVNLSGMTAAPRRVPAGTASTTVTLSARPGGRTVNFAVDGAAAAAGVVVAPNAPAAAAAVARSAIVTRPPGFTGTVVVTATDSVLAARTDTVRIRFL